MINVGVVGVGRMGKNHARVYSEMRGVDVIYVYDTDKKNGSAYADNTLPHDELLAKLRSFTNLRAVRDPKSSTGWTIELGPFPGWKNLPTW